MAKLSASQKIIEDLMVALASVRETEKTEPYIIEHAYGNLEDKAHGFPPRIIWIHEGGTILEKGAAEVVESESGSVTIPAVGYRKARYRARIWLKDVEKCERVLDQLVTAGLQLARPEQVGFENLTYKFNTQINGAWLENGELLEALIDIKPSVAAQPIPEDPNAEVEVQGFAFRAGIANPPNEPENESEYDVVRPTPWPG